jgi:hypothetical protein
MPTTPRDEDRLAAWTEQMIRRERGRRAPRDVSDVDNENQNPRKIAAFHMRTLHL